MADKILPARFIIEASQTVRLYAEFFGVAGNAGICFVWERYISLPSDGIHGWIEVWREHYHHLTEDEASALYLSETEYHEAVAIVRGTVPVDVAQRLAHRLFWRILVLGNDPQGGMRRHSPDWHAWYQSQLTLPTMARSRRLDDIQRRAELGEEPIASIVDGKPVLGWVKTERATREEEDRLRAEWCAVGAAEAFPAWLMQRQAGA